MFSLKVWPFVFAIYSSLICQKNVFLSASYAIDGLRDHIGGYVGCLHADVCLPSEFCKDDGLFGKCVTAGFEGGIYKLTPEEVNLIRNLRRDFQRFGLDFYDKYVQCVLRGLIFKFRLQYKQMNIVEICGETPFKIAKLPPKVDVPSFIENSPVSKPFSPEPEALDIDLNLLRNVDPKNYRKRLDLYDVEDHLVPDKETSLVDYLRSSFDYHNYDANSPLPHERTLRSADMAKKEKRFSRGKGVKSNPKSGLDHQVWMRFSRPVNYLDADRILRELSEIMGIRPPIAQYQLEKTGRVLLFFVPYESGLLAKDIVKMMPETLKWLNKNSILHYGVGFPQSEERRSARFDAVPTDTSLLSKEGFAVLMVICALAILTALLLFVHTLVKRRDRLSGYMPAGVKDARKPSERPLVGTASPSPSGSIANASIVSSRNDSLAKQSHQESTSSCSTSSPPHYQGSIEHGDKQGTYRRQLVSTGGSEASTESMAAYSTNRTTQLNNDSSWSEEPVQMTLDVTTGHLILSYMEEHLRNRDRLDADWEEIKAYESEEAVPCEAAKRPENACKNRAGCPIPYEQTRVMLSSRCNGYINASLMYDHDPRNPSYIAAETPLLSTAGDFWQMVWEQFAIVIVCLEPESALTQVIDDPFNISKQGENDTISQARYWPPEGCMIFGKFEVRLVSEHRQSSDYITRSFYLKDQESGETRTVTQFHFLSWKEDSPSCEVKTLLEFRRKVNKSFRAKNSPVIVHCRDGSSKTGTYLLLDLVLSRISKGVKELDVAASLEHLRDQRQGMIKTKGQFELVLAAIADEVNMMLNSAAIAASNSTSSTAS